jgi:hypothetical protein
VEAEINNDLQMAQDGDDQNNPRFQYYLQLLKRRLKDIHLGMSEVQRKVVGKRLDKANDGAHVYQEGDFVLVKPISTPRKLEPPLKGPYKIIMMRPPVVAKLQSLADAEDVVEIPVDRLVPFILRDLTMEQVCRLLEFDTPEVFEVERIMSHVGTTRRNLRFKVHWKGYPHDEDTEEPLANVLGNVQLLQYIREHPEINFLLRDYNG